MAQKYIYHGSHHRKYSTGGPCGNRIILTFDIQVQGQNISSDSSQKIISKNLTLPVTRSSLCPSTKRTSILSVSYTHLFWAVFITCLLGIPTMIICCWKTKEVVTPPPSQQSIPIKAQMKSLVNNKPVIILVIGQLILGCVIYGRAAMLAYYWQYNAGNAGYATTYGWVSLAAAIVGTGRCV